MVFKVGLEVVVVGVIGVVIEFMNRGVVVNIGREELFFGFGVFKRFVEGLFFLGGLVG